jgi:hypothetical protein
MSDIPESQQGGVAKWGVALLFASLAFLVYAPVFEIPFAQHDQFRYFVNKTFCNKDPQFDWLISVIGRPVAGWIEQLLFQCTRSLLDLAVYRFVAFGLITTLAVLLLDWLKKFPVALWERFAVCIGFICLPGIQNLIAMNNIPNCLTLLASFLAFLALEKKSWWALPAILVSLFAYPALAFFFFVPFAVELCFSNEYAEWAKRLLRGTLFLGLNSVVYLLIVKGVLQKMKYMPPVEVIPSTYLFKFDFLNHGFLQFFIHEAGPAIGNLWNIYPRQWVATLVFGGVFYFACKKGWKSALCAFLVFVLCQAPLIPLPHHLFVYRLFIAPTAVVFFWLVLNLPTPLKVGAAVLAAVGTNWVAMANALSSNMEINYICSQLKTAPMDNLHRIHYILPRYTKGFTGLPERTDEFNVPNTQHARELSMITECALARIGAKTLINGGPRYIAQEEILPLREDHRIDITFSYEGESVPLPEGAFVVRMNNLTEIR